MSKQRPDAFDLKSFLDVKADQYNQPGFIENDPIVIPHRFSKKQDIEISGFFASILAWGQRKTIINKCIELMERMDNAPHDFILNHKEEDLYVLEGFKHRTFNDTDLLYFVHFLKEHYTMFDSLEDAFLPASGVKEIYREEFLEIKKDEQIMESSSVCYQQELSRPPQDIETLLNYFRACFFSLPDAPRRTAKHISSPKQGSACKRLNMFLRWMVRNDDKGVDFGIWNRIQMSELICPFDLHVERVARKLGLVTRKQSDWKTAMELTEHLRQFDPSDPVRYDFALFGLGIEERFQES